MYKLTAIEKIIEDQPHRIYAVEKSGNIICDFTTEKETAEKIIELLNENKVESNQVFDVIEDLIYC